MVEPECNSSFSWSPGKLKRSPGIISSDEGYFQSNLSQLGSSDLLSGLLRVCRSVFASHNEGLSGLEKIIAIDEFRDYP